MAPRNSKIPGSPAQELLENWIAREDVHGTSLPVPAWFLMARRTWQPKAQGPSLLASSRGGTVRFRVALWLMAEAWTGELRGKDSNVRTPQADLARAVFQYDKEQGPEPTKARTRRIRRAFDALEDINLLCRDSDGTRWVMRPGRGPHETEPWRGHGSLRGTDDPSVPFPLTMFWNGWVDCLSGPALLVLLWLCMVSNDGQMGDEWFRPPRVRAQRIRVDPGTWDHGVEELRRWRFLEVGRVPGTSRGGVRGDHRAYRLRLRTAERPPRAQRKRLESPPTLTAEVPAIRPTEFAAPGWKPVLYRPGGIYGARSEVTKAFDVRPSHDDAVRIRFDPTRLADPIEGPHLHRALTEVLPQLGCHFRLVLQENGFPVQFAATMPPDPSWLDPFPVYLG